jgi:hypothetical protein
MAVVIGAGDRGAVATFEAMEVTAAVVIVLAVAGLLAALIIRARGDRRTCRPDPARGALRVRAVVIDRTPERTGVAPLALAAADPREEWPAGFRGMAARPEDGVKSEDNRRTL